MAKTTYTSIAQFIGKHDKKLIGQMLNGLDFVKQVRVIRNASLDGHMLPKMTVAGGIRPLNLDVETRDGAHRAFSGRKLLVYTGMKIIEIIPEEAERTFMSDMLEPGAKDIPFAQWVWEQEFKKIAAEINDNIYLSDYQGTAALFNPATDYALGAYVSFGDDLDIYKAIADPGVGESPLTHPAKWSKVNEAVISEGWGTLIADEITGGGIAGANLIATGALDNTNALTKIELMYNGMTVAHRKAGGTFKMSHAKFRAYLEHERTLYPYATTPQSGVGVKHVYGDPNWTIEPCTWMGTSGRVIATQKENLVFGTQLESNINSVSKVIESLHGYKSVVKWRQGCEISDLETLYVNNQA